MDRTGTVIENLARKIERIISMNSRLRKERLSLERECSRLLEKCNVQEEKIAELERRLRVLETARSMQDVSGGARTAKLRINRLLREIDNCIALMNR